MTEPNNGKIAELLQSDEVRAKAEDPDTLRSVQEGFEDAFEKVKERLGESWEDVQTLYKMAFDQTFDMKKEVKYSVIGALAYLVSPIDLLPDRMGPLGLADDVAVLLFALKYARPEIDRYRGFQAAFEPSRGSETSPDLA